MRPSTIVRRLREFTGETQAEFAAKVGVTHSAVQFWETNGAKVSPFNRIRLLRYAREVSAPGDVIEALEAIQPDLGEAAKA